MRVEKQTKLQQIQEALQKEKDALEENLLKLMYASFSFFLNLYNLFIIHLRHILGTFHCT